MTLDTQRLNALLGTMVVELGAAANGVLVSLGDRLGLWRALHRHGPLTSAALARATGTQERYVREWLSAQAASGFVTWEAADGTFRLTAEQAAVLADEDSPVFMGGGFSGLGAVYAGEDRLAAAFRSGEGIGWGEHCACLFCGTERFFRPGYRAHLVAEWLPSLAGVVAKLEAGARVVDVGCGHGASTLIMADAFPRSAFVGIDFHAPSIDHARSHLEGRRNVRFEVARAQDFAGHGFDFATLFDALHDMGDPAGAARHIRDSLAPDGTLMVVEPAAGDSLAENLGPVGRAFYAYSTSLCVPASLSQEVGAALGAQAGEARLAAVLREGGFSHVRRTVTTPFNMVLEARP
ncbi:class I SAM-dependent methyltransferase [Rhodoplanes sp. TEM]|uniref:Class I SAM-dependent methyltransferase n=1 Tax=Rhodoplanes tepidamans TaxID=200616 RepID=A0ABT5JA01_RHOTP|nr:MULTISPECIES: class I SAM-dependent methyltransferase [Rhodoplanes]MDC7786474.1 class I SAM-dependent methyltransferase [Rhodoplanes tepidamans]MDC7985473.1 class I SAM-dependent methyltransferase [Rhodoplanes sp. TEM]